MGTIQGLSVAEAIQTRRAVKAFDPDHKMTMQETERLLSLAVLAPTAFNIQNWRLVLLRDPLLRKQVRAQAWDQAQVTDASLLVDGRVREASYGTDPLCEEPRRRGLD